MFNTITPWYCGVSSVILSHKQHNKDNNNESVSSTGKWASSSSRAGRILEILELWLAHRPRPALLQWLPYRNDSSAEGLSQTLYCA